MDVSPLFNGETLIKMKTKKFPIFMFLLLAATQSIASQSNNCLTLERNTSINIFDDFYQKSIIIQKEIGKDYGGSWISHEKNGTSHLFISTKNISSSMNRLGCNTYLKFTKSENSLKDLDFAFEILILLMQNEKSQKQYIYSIEKNIEDNIINIKSNPNELDDLSRKLFTAGINLKLIKFIPQDQPFQHFNSIDIPK